MTLILFGILLALLAIAWMLYGIQGALSYIAAEMKRYNDEEKKDREKWSRMGVEGLEDEVIEKHLDNLLGEKP